MKKIFLLLTLIPLSLGASYGQLSVRPSHPVNNKLEDMVQSLVGSGVNVSNITSNQPSGTTIYGSFTEPSGELGIGNGLLMTNGGVQNALGPNNTNSTSGIMGLPGDPSLTAIVQGATLDACVIEFDIITTSTEISFNYIFGSEEYIQFVGTQWNDVFAFLISGPGIVGSRNIALVPGTSTPVTINNVNPFTNPLYYHDNVGTAVQYNGYTVKLKAVAEVMPCHTYHLKLAIADVADDIYDSGVFIEAGSLSGSEGLILGDGNIKASDTLRGCSSAFPVRLKAGIYELPNYIWTRNGQDVASGNKFYNATSNGLYKVKAFSDGGNCFWIDSIYISLDPNFTLTTSADTSICEGGSASLNVVATGSSGYTYLWSPPTGLSDPSIRNPVSTPVGDITYVVTVKAGLCTNERSVRVSIVPPLQLQANTPLTGCVGKGVQLHASGADNYQWSPAAPLNNPAIADPIAILNSDAVFKVVGSNRCYRDSLEVAVTIYPFPAVQAYGDTTICYGGTAQLSADNVNPYQYSWAPATALSDASVFNPQARPFSTTRYVLSVNNHGCVTRDSVLVQVREEIKAQIFLLEKDGQIPWTVKLGNTSSGASDYTWYFTRFDSTKVFEPQLTILTEDYYRVILKAAHMGCYDYDTLTLTAYHLFIPNIITPNLDGKNDSFEITGLGENFSLEVYNRWGDRVYKKTDYKNEWTGEGLSDGIYYFTIHDLYKQKDYRGWIQLLR